MPFYSFTPFRISDAHFCTLFWHNVQKWSRLFCKGFGTTFFKGCFGTTFFKGCFGTTFFLKVVKVVKVVSFLYP